MEVKRLIPTSVLMDENMSSPKVDVWDIEFRTPEGEPPLKGKMKTSPENRKNIPVTGEQGWFGLSTVPMKDGSGDVLSITWPAPPSLRPAPGQVTEPVVNPVKSQAEGVAVAPEKPYKAPDRDRMIGRQVCMKAAVDYHASLPDKPENPGVAMRLMAEQWEEWLFRSV